MKARWSMFANLRYNERLTRLPPRWRTKINAQTEPVLRGAQP
jgi:hypothetical protein